MNNGCARHIAEHPVAVLTKVMLSLIKLPFDHTNISKAWLPNPENFTSTSIPWSSQNNDPSPKYYNCHCPQHRANRDYDPYCHSQSGADADVGPRTVPLFTLYVLLIISFFSLSVHCSLPEDNIPSASGITERLQGIPAEIVQQLHDDVIESTPSLMPYTRSKVTRAVHTFCPSDDSSLL